MGSGDGPKNGTKLVIFVIICVVRHGTPLDTFIDLNKAEKWHLRIVSNSDYITSKDWIIRNKELKKDIEESESDVI